MYRCTSPLFFFFFLLLKSVEHPADEATLTLSQGMVTPVQELRYWSHCSGLSNALQATNQRLFWKQVLAALIIWVRGKPEKQGLSSGVERQMGLWNRKCLGSNQSWPCPEGGMLTLASKPHWEDGMHSGGGRVLGTGASNSYGWS